MPTPRAVRSPPVPRPPLLLLPPSEGKAPGGRPPGRADGFATELESHRARVRAELGSASAVRDPARRSALLGVRGELLDRAMAATAALIEGTAPVLPAWRRYTGVVWAALDPATVPAADRRRVLVPSAVYGITTAADPVADYRLKMSVVLGRLGRLSTFWRPHLTGALVDRARGRVVLDLLPAEHAHAIDWTVLAGVSRVVHVRFVGADGGRAVGHEAKSAKGRLARLLLDGGLGAVPGFDADGWTASGVGDLITVGAPAR